MYIATNRGVGFTVQFPPQQYQYKHYLHRSSPNEYTILKIAIYTCVLCYLKAHYLTQQVLLSDK